MVIGMLSLDASAQSEQQLANYFKRNPDADVNNDGVLTREEAKAHRRNDPTRGDNLSSVSEIPAVKISAATSEEGIHLFHSSNEKAIKPRTKCPLELSRFSQTRRDSRWPSKPSQR